MEELEKSPKSPNDTSEFVTVVSVGTLESSKTDQDTATAGYVTVLTIGDENIPANEQVEEVLVYRLPGERLGFGLKFEGGTKASEFVKRLFIQSCAPDSPASRVRSSWGCLTEGDEVLEIDSIPVNSMTRIDCVRCLKESNVVIKLLVKHCKNSENVPRAKSTEDLPLVISAEKKRVPPPPPPVPPRKIPRKLYKEPGAIMVPPKAFSDVTDAPVPTFRDTKVRHQSPRSSTRLLQPRQSPEVVKRDRKLSDGSIGPPDAEVYVDLFSQEPSYCLSESDDTGSSISTVVDRLGSFPTTTTSSFAGSLPSTPTSVQKQLTPNNFDDDYDNDQDYLFTKLVSLQTTDAETIEEPPIEKVEKCSPLQPPANFQDAPLSYGDEDVKVVEASFLETNNRPPPPPPRSKNLKEKNNNDYDVKNVYSENLPRLVDFVPKTANAETYEWLKKFLENEQRVSCDCYILDDDKPYDTVTKWADNDFYTYNWSPSSQLTTIGEDEEEGYIEPQRSPNLKTPIVIVESTEDKVEESCNGDGEQELDPEQCEDDDNVQIAAKITETDVKPAPKIPLSSDVDVMDSLPINSRQPPDGHEFPDTHQEVKIAVMENVPKLPGSSSAAVRKDLQGTNTVKNMIAVFSTANNDTSTVKKTRSVISSQSSFSSFSSTERVAEAATPPRLHFRSQSLIDISEQSKPANDRWSQLVEQRRKGLSKLKGLIIPEHTDADGSAVVVDLPEIKSTTTPILPLLESEPVKAATHIRNTSTPTTWSFESISAVPKYSPAFKRKSLQLQSAPSETGKIEKPVKRTITSQLEESPMNLSLGDAPKSLESITSPTRSDCSFEYISTSPELKITNNQPCEPPRKVKDDNVKSDESDNDSAVSSSQSSYMSRHSPPPSPNHLQYQSEMSPGDRRFLKAQSIEAINRKNILASAKCRSGRDLKVGSPLIQRKFDSDGNPETPLRSKVDCKPPPFSRNVRTTSVTDLRRNFEKLSPAPTPAATVQTKIQPRLSLNSTTPTPVVPTPAKRNSLPILPPNITKPPNNLDTDQILQEALSGIDENLTKDELKVVALRPEISGGSVGITLAGGTDYETKEITVHKVRSGSAAYRDGRLQKGDRIISINGKCMKGVTHAESIAILKEPVPEVIIVAYTGKDQAVTSPPPITRHSSMFELTTPMVKEPPTTATPVNKTEIAVTLVKDSSGLGFSMEGGKDSPQGDLPLIIKKLFTGGNADKCGQLKAGDELVEINKVDVTNMPRIDAWSLMKKLPNGEVALKVRR